MCLALLPYLSRRHRSSHHPRLCCSVWGQMRIFSCRGTSSCTSLCPVSAQQPIIAQGHTMAAALTDCLEVACVTSALQPRNLHSWIIQSLVCGRSSTAQDHRGGSAQNQTVTQSHTVGLNPSFTSVETQGQLSLNLCGLPELLKAQQSPSAVINHAAVSAVTLQCRFTFTTGHIPHRSRMPILTNKGSS